MYSLDENLIDEVRATACFVNGGRSVLELELIQIVFLGLQFLKEPLLCDLLDLFEVLAD